MKIVCPCSALCLSPLKPSLVWFSHEPIEYQYLISPELRVSFSRYYDFPSSLKLAHLDQTANFVWRTEYIPHYIQRANFQACERTRASVVALMHFHSEIWPTHDWFIFLFIYLLIFATNNNTDNMDSWTQYNTSPCNFRQQKAIAAVNATEDKSLEAKNCHW